MNDRLYRLLAMLQKIDSLRAVARGPAALRLAWQRHRAKRLVQRLTHSRLAA